MNLGSAVSALAGESQQARPLPAHPKVSIVVPSRDGRIPMIREQLAGQSLQDVEVIVEVSGSPALGRNRGALRAAAPILLFLDDDVRLSHGHLLEEMIRLLESVDDRSAIGVFWRLPPDATRFQRWEHAQSFAPIAGRPSGEGLVEVPWHDAFGTCCFAIRSDTFRGLGGFDDGLTS